MNLLSLQDMNKFNNLVDFTLLLLTIKLQDFIPQ